MTKKLKINKYLSIAILITGANILGKVLGFIRDILLSYYYGTSAISDAFFLTIAIPTMILGVFTNSTDSAIIPQYNRIKETQGKETADYNFSNIINIISLIGIFVSILIFVFPQFCLKIFAPGFSQEQTMYAIKFLRCFSFIGFSHILYCFFTTYNTIYNKIGVRAILSFSTSLIVIIALIINPDENMMSIIIAYIISNLLCGILPIIYSKFLKYKHSFRIDIKSKELKKFFIIFFPIMLAALLNDLNMFVDKTLASNMGEGSISSINYASKLISIFDNMLVIGLSVVILPVFSKLKLNGKNEEFKSYSAIIIKTIILILLPIAIVSLIMSKEIIEVIYMRGHFNRDSVNVVSQIFSAYALQIVLLSVQAIFMKLFHSIENTKITLYINAIGVFINIILSILLSSIIGLKGLAIATTIATFVICILLFIMFKKNIGWDKSNFNIIDIIKILIGNVLFIIIVFLLKNLTTNTLLNIIITFIVSYIVYSLYIMIAMKKLVKQIRTLLIKKEKI